MFNTLIHIYDWYHEEIKPTCPPPSDANILCPIFYGKINITSKANAVEVSMNSSGQVIFVRKFSNDAKNSNLGQRYVLTPSCIQHRRNGANCGDKEYAFFNKFSVLFRKDRSTWLSMFEEWVRFHRDQGLPGDISPVENIIKFVSTANPDLFLATWNGDGIIDSAEKTIIVFTVNGHKIFDENPLLWHSYAAFYEQWCQSLYDVTFGCSALSGKSDLNIRMNDGTPISFGISYSNSRKIIMKPQGATTTLDTVRIFNGQKDFNNYSIGLRDLWKFHTVFDYLSEQQREWDLENRNIFFFIPSVTATCTYDRSLSINDMLTTLKQFQAGYKQAIPTVLKDVRIGYIYWTSSSNGRSSISEFQSFPVEQYSKNITQLYDFFKEEHKFCLYKIANLLETETLFIRKIQHELIHSILCAQPVPEHIMKRMIAKSLNPVKTSAPSQAARHSGYSEQYAEYYYRNMLEITVGLLLYNEQQRTKKGMMAKMSLDKNNADRSYLYGRLVAVYQRAEEIAMGDQHRTTNAEKCFNSVYNRPTTSIAALSKKVSPYMNKLSNNHPQMKIFIDKLFQEIWDSFSPEDAIDATPLGHMFLVGYYCQRQDFFVKKADATAESEEDNE